jgi:hypothetical protein
VGLVSGTATGAGARAENKIATWVKAYIDGAPPPSTPAVTGGISADTITLTAEDYSLITSDVAAVTLGGSIGLVSGAVAVGVSLSRNQIGNEVAAYIANVHDDPITLADFEGVASTTGAIALNATEDATIRTTSTAVAIAVSGGLISGADSGGGADAINVILTKTNAYIANSDVSSAGDVTLTALDTSNITATVAAVSAAGSIGLGSGVLSIGASVAKNLIGYDLSDTRVPAEVQAYVQNSSIDAAGALIQNATADQTIDAGVGAGAVGISAGLASGSGVGAGASAENKIATLVKAYIDGDAATGISAGSITLTALDTATITSDVAAVSLSGSIGLISGAVSIGVSLSRNHISNEVAAYIANADNTGTTVGAIALNATEEATITTTSTAVAMSAGAGLISVAASGGGADAINVILTRTNAYIANSDVSSAGDVTLTALDTSTIDATVVGISTALSAALGGGSGSIGVSVAKNLIGYDLSDTRVPAEVRAYVQDSSINATGALIQSATADQTIDAGVGAGSLGVSIGLVSGSGVGAGATAENKIATLVQAYIDGDSHAGSAVPGISADRISLTALDSALITSDVAAVSLGGSLGLVSGAISVGVSLSRNHISNEVEAYIANADDGVVTTGGAIELRATEDANRQQRCDQRRRRHANRAGYVGYRRHGGGDCGVAVGRSGQRHPGDRRLGGAEPDRLRFGGHAGARAGAGLCAGFEHQRRWRLDPERTAGQ